MNRLCARFPPRGVRLCECLQPGPRGRRIATLHRDPDPEHGSAMAILLHGDFYKVAVSSAGSYDGPANYSPVLEKYFGMPDYPNDRATQSGPTDRPGYIWETSASANAHKLRGRLLLAIGDLDENAPPAMGIQFATALIEAGKSFDFLLLPG
ncbi:MAG: prolyl oligopeptidase family serine peptidase, partial [Phycisphaeraceae bacterium]|nr:prolyl oligopeptidase family serine peptidase [Phycisphaeraceae bacterium]